MDVLDLRQLNRATLARQSLLERSAEPVADLVRRAGGLQAQLPSAPTIGLWSRLAGFTSDHLQAAVREGKLVRGTTLRGTLHLHEVDDYRALRMSVQSFLDTAANGMRRRMEPDDFEAALELGRAQFAAGPITVAELKRTLAESLPRSEAQALANVSRLLLQLLIVPDPDSPHGWRVNAPFVDARSIVGDTLAPPDPEHVVRRFLEVLGPGSAKDAGVWSSVRGLRKVMQEMHDRGELITVATWDGGELYDLPDAPRPDGDVVVPPRFLPMWDNLLLSHADRSRVLDPAHKAYLASKNGMPPPAFLVDGFVAGRWKAERDGARAELVLTPFGRIPAAAEDPLVAEGEALLRFLEPDAGSYRVRVG